MTTQSNTLIQQLGFLDPDRKKLKHDEIQIWVYQNFESILSQIIPGYKLAGAGRNLDIQMEYPVIDNRRNFVVGFIDVYCKHPSVSVEVKCEIPVLGDLIRQIQFYRKYRYGPWLVVSPDDRYSTLLNEQGIHFLKYPFISQCQLFE